MKSNDTVIKTVIKIEQTQLNARIPTPLKVTTKSVAGMTGLNVEDIATDALCFYYGVSNDTMNDRRDLCLKALKRLDAAKDLRNIVTLPRLLLSNLAAA